LKVHQRTHRRLLIVTRGTAAGLPRALLASAIGRASRLGRLSGRMAEIGYASYARIERVKGPVHRGGGGTLPGDAAGSGQQGSVP